jgi:transcriptional regulator with XRE-family HTH domain
MDQGSSDQRARVSGQRLASELQGVQVAMGDERSATSVDKRLGQRLRARRLEMDLSQEQLAERLGVTFQQVQKYEKGVNRIAASRLVDIATALETPIVHFFEGMGPGKGAKSDRATEMMATPEGAQLVGLFLDIKSKPVRRKVIDLVRALAQGD